MNVAIIHYWLVGMRGGEKVLEALCEIYPDADIYTHVYAPQNISAQLNQHKIQTSFIQKLPKATTWYPYYLPLMPMALESLDLSQYDLIISSESGPAKGIIPPPTAQHVCYVHSPMRYVWDMFHTYFGKSHWLKRIPITIMMHYLRLWDSNSALRTDHFIANSSFVAQRITKYYRRDSQVIHPPVDIKNFYPIEKPSVDYYLWLGELNHYKNPLEAVSAFNHNGKKLIMVGEGKLQATINEQAKGNISLKSKVSQQEIVALFQNCRALIYTGVEDFGIIPVEVMACGRPVIAYQRGGVTDSVQHGITGILYSQQSPQCLNEAIDEFEKNITTFNAGRIRKHSESFSKAQFIQQFKQFMSAISL